MNNLIEKIDLFCNQTSILLSCQIMHCAPENISSSRILAAGLPSPFSSYFYLHLDEFSKCPPEAGKVYHISSTLGIYFSLCLLGKANRIICAGPYRIREANMDHLNELTSRYGLSIEERITYTNFYKLIPQISLRKSESAFQLFLSTFCGHESYEPVVLEETAPATAPPEKMPLPSEAEEVYEAITMRYAAENTYLEDLVHGKFDEEGVSLPFPLFGKINSRSADPLRDIKIFGSILNTLSRKAIERAGIHPYYIDLLSSKLSIRIESASTVDEVESILQKLPGEYSRLVVTHSVSQRSPLIKKVLHYIGLHLNEDLSLPILASCMGINSSYLSKQFNKEMQTSISSYINEQRIKEAMRLLKSTKQSIAEIANALSYGEVNYFTKVFKKHTGKTPSEYRSHLDNFTECHR